MLDSNDKTAVNRFKNIVSDRYTIVKAQVGTGWAMFDAVDGSLHRVFAGTDDLNAYLSEWSEAIEKKQADKAFGDGFYASV